MRLCACITSLRRMVGDICYNNAADYFGFDVK